MQVTARTEYALRALVHLGLEYDNGGLTTASTLSSEQCIPIKFLEQILLRLCKEGIVESCRGARGGYRMVVDPKKINLCQVLAITEDTLVKPVGHRKRPVKGKSAKKIMTSCTSVWDTLTGKVESYLKSVTLAQLIKAYRK